VEPSIPDRPSHDWLTVSLHIKPDRRRSATPIDASRERRRPLNHRSRTDLDALNTEGHEMPLHQVTDGRTDDTDSTALLRMDDDGGAGAEPDLIAPAGGASGPDWGIPTGTIPGEREPGPQTRF
jgi:hypothetical protein